jgi:hypothetical protein
MTVGTGLLAATKFKQEGIDDDAELGGETFPGGSRLTIDLGFDVERQEQSQWCWAAVAVSVARHFDSASRWRQCTVVNAELNQTSCCDDGGSPSCGRPWYLDRALATVAHLHAVRSGALDFSEAYAEVVANQPPCMRIGWAGGGGHFVAVVGVRQAGGDRFLRIGDPLHGTVEEGWTDPAEPYMGYGSWTDPYFTQP